MRERFEQEIRQNFKHLEDGLSSEMYDGQDSPLVADMFRLYSAATEGQQELIEALGKFGKHLPNCKIPPYGRDNAFFDKDCTCGFEAVLARYGK